jgi:hypothetical protein
MTCSTRREAALLTAAATGGSCSPCRGKFLCRIGVHRWERMRNPEGGEWYLECARGRKEKDELSLGGGPDAGDMTRMLVRCRASSPKTAGPNGRALLWA